MSAKRYDWEALMLEWVQGNETLNQFRIRKGIINSTNFYKQVEKCKWEEHRAKVTSRAIAKVEGEIVKKTAAEWSFQSKQWKTIEGIAARLLKRINARTATDDNIELDTKAIAQIKELAATLQTALKAQKLIVGEPTGDEAPTAGTMSHGQVVDLIKAVASGDPRVVLPGTIIEGEIVKEDEKP